MKKIILIFSVLLVFSFSLFSSASASVLYENGFSDAAFSAYGKDGSKGVFLSLASLENDIVTSVSVSDTTRYIKFDFFPLDLTAENLPIIYLSNSACVAVNQDGIACTADGATYSGSENWIFRWYEITVAYSASRVQIFADDRCILNCAAATSARGTASVRPAPVGKGDVLIDNLEISEKDEPEIVFTKYHKNGVPAEFSYNGAVTVGAAVYNASAGAELRLALGVKDKNGKLLDAAAAQSGSLAAGADTYIECGFSYPLSGAAEITAYLWDSSLTPVESSKKLECK